MFSLLSLGLDVHILHIIEGQRFTLFVIKVLSSLSDNFLDSSVGASSSLDVSLIGIDSQHLIVAFIDVQLHWVLVVGEQSIVSIGQIGQSSTQIERVLDWGSVMHRSEEMVLKGQDNNLLEKLVSHQELFA